MIDGGLSGPTYALLDVLWNGAHMFSPHGTTQRIAWPEATNDFGKTSAIISPYDSQEETYFGPPRVGKQKFEVSRQSHEFSECDTLLA